MERGLVYLLCDDEKIYLNAVSDAKELNKKDYISFLYKNDNNCNVNQGTESDSYVENLNHQALEVLENRIKKWHLDLGCKEASITKLNRIDINVSNNFLFNHKFKISIKI